MSRISSIVCLAFCASLVGCKTGYNRPLATNSSTTTIPCNPKAVDTNASAEALAVLKLVATFSCEKDGDNTKRVLSGQVLGTVNDAQNYDRYNQLFSVFKDTNGNNNTPAIMGLDYALTSTWDKNQLAASYDVIESHLDESGLVILSWTPANPWQSDFNTSYTSSVNLPSLTQSISSEAKTRWDDNVKLLINALLDLQQRRIAVIFRPLPLMNSDRYWWGINATGDNKESEFEGLWSDLFKRLNDAGLENLLWAYSPLDSSESNTKGFDWGFNKEFVDIVAPVVRNNNLDIRDYEAYKTLGKPLGLAEFSPATGTDSSFDTLKYESRLITNYPAMAFWLSGVNDGDIKRTLADNKNGYDLLIKSTVITAEKVDSQNLPSN
ncbi:MAG TPA: glycosyl hydrolase [Cellvibrionaceae bacterium]